MNVRSQITITSPARIKNLLEKTAQSLKDTGALVVALENDLLDQRVLPHATVAVQTDLQAIDLLTQTLDEIHGVLARIANDMPPELTICQDRILRPIKLEALRHRLSDDQNAGISSDLPDQHKKIEIF